MTTSKTTKATRATIILGDLPVDCFQLPDGSYRYGYEFLAELMGRDKSILSNNKSIWGLSKLTKGLVSNGSRNPKVSVDGINYAYLTSDQLTLVLGGLVELDPEPFLPILLACAIEALERRADKAFGIKRTEEERNQRLQSRRDGIVSRHFWTDTIEVYIENHPEVSDNYKKFIYIHVSDLINNAVLGTTAKKYRENLGLPEGTITREYLTTEQLKQIDTLEKAAGLRVVKNDLCPKQALKDIIGLLF